jgi:ubiquitin-like modifier-activating enzyme 5
MKCILALFRYLLNFGTVSDYVGYNALEDFFPRMSLKPNRNCDDAFCRQRQEEYQVALRNAPPPPEPEAVVEEVVHEDNEWGETMDFFLLFPLQHKLNQCNLT